MKFDGNLKEGTADPAPVSAGEVELTVVMPCLNEVLTLGTCIEKAQRCIGEMGVNAEIVVADNGSTDGSVELAEKLGARVVHQTRKGYGAALKAGIEAARGRFVIMGDCDDSYDFTGLAPFVEELRRDKDLVMGNRFRGGIEKGAMPPHHRYFGNPLLTFLGRTFFGTRTIGDFYCGLRGFRKEAIDKLALHSDGMEFALEMVVKSCINGLRIAEVPTTLARDGRDRPPHLKSFRDGWRSLRFYLVMAPRWMYGVPGTFLLLVGLLGVGRLSVGPLEVGGLQFDYHTLLYSAAAVVLGYQMLLLGIFAKLMAIESGLHPRITRLQNFLKRSTLGWFAGAGVVITAAGIALGVLATQSWSAAGFGSIESASTLRIVILSVLALIVGGQTFLAGFFFGLVELVEERSSHLARRAGLNN